MTRPMTSLIERDLLTITARFRADRSNWVRMWVDPDHAVRSDCGQITALRGITWDGKLLWLVHHPDKRHGYHSAHDCPFAAIDEAEQAWRERRRVRQCWPFVEDLARDLRRGRRRMEVRIEDAHASALCTVGIEGFLGRIGLGRVQRVSGRTAGALMLIEPQVGFVILAAFERLHGPVTPAVAVTPAAAVTPAQA